MSCKDCEDLIEFEKSFEEGISYTEKKISDNIYERFFSKDVNKNWLKWHWDEEDRVVKVINESDWKFQFDNELPVSLDKNKEFKIPKGEYHRIIKGSTDLIIEVKKNC